MKDLHWELMSASTMGIPWGKSWDNLTACLMVCLMV
jgi:hypothetical protein